ncbi:acyltransferase, partial [Chromatiaceae bacterium AAb-1]|nr:acyltransferase [Chromatiaceae bacterium AAb-1]
FLHCVCMKKIILICNKVSVRTIREIKRLLFVFPRIMKYRLLSNCNNFSGEINRIQPVLFTGKGRIEIRNNVQAGVSRSPYFYNSYIYIEARCTSSFVVIGDNVSINNNVSIISSGAGIEIGEYTLIGHSVEIIDSDFHGLGVNQRASEYALAAKVVIGSNVFIGNGVKVLKGVKIGDNSVIASGSVVTSDVETNAVYAGIPARFVKQL